MKRFKFSGFAFKLFLVINIFVLVSLVILVSISSHQFTKQIERSYAEKLSSTAKEKAFQFDKTIKDLEKMTELIGSHKYIYDFFKKASKNEVNENVKNEIRENITTALQANKKIFRNVFFGFQGIVYIAATKKAEGYNLENSNAEWYITTKATKKPHLGRIMLDPIEKTPVLVPTFPLLDEKGELLSILATPIRLNAISLEILKNGSNSNFKTILIDTDGIVIADTELSHIYKFDFSKESPSLKNFYKKIINEMNGIGFFTLEDIKYFAAFCKMNNGLYAITYTPVSVYEEPIKKNITDTILILFILIIIIGFLSYLIANKIITPVQKVAKLITKLSKGDLSGVSAIKSNDEIGQLSNAYNEMITHLTKVVSDIQNSADYIKISTAEISESSNRIAQGSNEQAAASEEISSSIEQISSSVQQNAQNSEHSAGIIQSIDNKMSEIKTSFEDSFKATSDILLKSNTINEIAEKINVLAINAAIEAARAGQYGKGFNVVASEIRKLSVHTQKAVQIINELSQNSITKLGHTNQLLINIAPEISKSLQLATEINASSSEQNSGLTQINQAMNQFTSVIQANTASAEELATSSEQLYSQAQSMVEMMAFFNTRGFDIAVQNSQIMKKIEALQAILSKNMSLANVNTVSDTTEAKISSNNKKMEGIEIDLDSENDFEQF